MTIVSCIRSALQAFRDSSARNGLDVVDHKPLSARFRNAIAAAFPSIEPAREAEDLYYEAMGRIARAQSGEELRQAQDFIAVKNVQTPHSFPELSPFLQEKWGAIIDSDHGASVEAYRYNRIRSRMFQAFGMVQSVRMIIDSGETNMAQPRDEAYQQLIESLTRKAQRFIIETKLLDLLPIRVHEELSAFHHNLVDLVADSSDAPDDTKDYLSLEKGGAAAIRNSLEKRSGQAGGIKLNDPFKSRRL